MFHVFTEPPFFLETRATMENPRAPFPLPSPFMSYLLKFLSPGPLLKIREYPPFPSPTHLCRWDLAGKFEEDMKEYVGKMKKYVTSGIRRAKHQESEVRVIIYTFCPYIKALGLGKIPSSPHMGSGTWKSETLVIYTFLPI